MKQIVMIGTISDLHNSEKLIDEVREYCKTADLDLLLVAGDIAQMGSEYEIKHMLSKINDLEIETILVMGNHDCFCSETEVLTNNGWKLGIDINEQDILAQYDKNKDIIDFAKPLNIIKRKHTGKMYLFQKKEHDICATGNHRMLVQRKHCKKEKYDDLEFIKAEDITGERTRFKLSAAGSMLDTNLTDDEIKLLAFIYSDGGFKENKNDKSYMFYQSKIKVLNEFKKVLGNLKINFKQKSRKRDTKEICGKKLKKEPLESHEIFFKYKKLDNIIKKRYRLPRQLYNMSKRQFDMFIKTYLICDGSKHDDNNAFCLYGKEEILDDIQILAHMNGMQATKSVFRENDHRLNVKPKTTSVTKLKFRKKIDYDGQVWCATMPKGTLIVRRNGKVSIQGNCGAQHNKTMCYEFENITELRNEYILTKGVEIYGSPYSKQVGQWGFGFHSEQTMKDYLPTRKVDILLTHGGPNLKSVSTFNHWMKGEIQVGSDAVTDYIKNFQPIVSVSGHCHECGGTTDFIGNTEVINTSCKFLKFGIEVDV